jgi:hypothetical protein
VSKDLEPRRPASPAGRTPDRVPVAAHRLAEVSTRSPRQLRYSPAEQIGFDHVPAEVVGQLRRENVIAGPEIAAWAEPAVTKRRRDGSAYQVVSAWWADSSRLVAFDVVRDLEDIGKGQFRPAGSWVPRGTVYQFPATVSAVTYSSAPAKDALSSRKSETAATATAEHPIDVLPADVQSSLRGGMAGAFLQTKRNWARETVVAHRISAGRIHVLRAHREGRSERSLSLGTWSITSLDTPVASSRRIGGTPDSPSVDVGQRQTPSIEPRRTYW